MLQFIRDRATGWVAWTIVTLIIIPFALWGIYDYMTPAQSVAVATVNGVEIDARSFNRHYQQQRRQLQALLGGMERADMIDDLRLREQTLDELIDDELLIQAGRNDDLRVSDQQLAQVISGLSLFQGEDGFSQELYDAFLRNRGLSPLGFEFEMRRDLLIEQVAAAVLRNAQASERGLREALRLNAQQRVYSLLRLPAEDHRPDEVEESEIAAYYESNRTRFASPEEVNVEYIVLSRDEMARAVVVGGGELRSLYEERKSDYAKPAQAAASHILIKLAPDADAASEAAAREKLDDVSRRLAEGMSFEEAAENYSEDTGSARQGGALGWFSRGVMDPAFEEAVFALGEGERSGVVRTDFGLHLIEVTGRKDAGVVEFEEVRERLLADYQIEVAEQLFFEQVEQLANLAFEHPDTLAVAAEAVGVQPQETGFISRRPDERSGLAGEARFLEAAFSSEVLAEGNNSELLELDGARVAVLRVKEHRPSRRRELEEVRESVRAELFAQRGAERAREAGFDVIERLRGGEAAESLAMDIGFGWSSEARTGRRPETLSPELSTLLFRIPAPAAGRRSYDGMAEDNGDFVVLALHAVEPGSEEDAQAKAEAKERLNLEFGRAELAATVAALRAGAAIEVNEENLR